jgi:hypothetical protein
LQVYLKRVIIRYQVQRGSAAAFFYSSKKLERYW